MRCRDAKIWLAAQRDGDLEPSVDIALQEHLRDCSICRSFEHSQRLLDSMLCTSSPRVQAHVPTDHIMLAIQQQKRITQQLEDIRQQQQTRIARFRSAGAAIAALGFFTLSSIPLLLLAVTIIQTDLVMKALSVLNGVIDMFIIFAQYVQAGLMLITSDNWLLSGVALAVVIMMGMWLRLMRPPQSA